MYFKVYRYVPQPFLYNGTLLYKLLSVLHLHFNLRTSALFLLQNLVWNDYQVLFPTFYQYRLIDTDTWTFSYEIDYKNFTKQKFIGV